MPYKSDKQRAWMHINEPKIAARWDKEEKKKKKGGTYSMDAIKMAAERS